MAEVIFRAQLVQMGRHSDTADLTEDMTSPDGQEGVVPVTLAVPLSDARKLGELFGEWAYLRTFEPTDAD